MAKSKKQKPVAGLTPAVPSAEQVHGVDRYKAEDGMRAIERMAEIKADPKVHRAALKLMKEKHAQMGGMIAQHESEIGDDEVNDLKSLRAKRNKKFGQPQEE